MPAESSAKGLPSSLVMRVRRAFCSSRSIRMAACREERPKVSAPWFSRRKAS